MKKNFVRVFFSLVVALVMMIGSVVCEDFTLLGLIAEQTEGDVPESAAALIQKDLYQVTVNNVEITVREAAYDGRSLFLVYSSRMTDVDHPLGLTAADYYGDELPEGADPDEYVYSLVEDAEDLLEEHNVGWWIDDIWFNGKPMNDMPDGSGQFVTGTGAPGELVECDIWRLDNLDITLAGKVQISLPIGDRPEAETALPDVTAKISEAAFSPIMTYIKLELAVNPDALDAFIAENGEGARDEDGEIMWPYGPMDVFGEWLESMQLTDGDGTILFPDNIGPSEYGDESAEFILPYLETIPETLYLAPVGDDGVADLSLAIRVV